MYIDVYRLNSKLEVVEKEVLQLQLLSSVQAELDSVLLNKSGIENKLKKLLVELFIN